MKADKRVKLQNLVDELKLENEDLRQQLEKAYDQIDFWKAEHDRVEIEYQHNANYIMELEAKLRENR